MKKTSPTLIAAVQERLMRNCLRYYPGRALNEFQKIMDDIEVPEDGYVHSIEFMSNAGCLDCVTYDANDFE